MVKKLRKRMFGDCLVTIALGSGLPWAWLRSTFGGVLVQGEPEYPFGLVRLGYSSSSFNPAHSATRTFPCTNRPAKRAALLHSWRVGCPRGAADAKLKLQIVRLLRFIYGVGLGGS